QRCEPTNPAPPAARVHLAEFTVRLRDIPSSKVRGRNRDRGRSSSCERSPGPQKGRFGWGPTRRRIEGAPCDQSPHSEIPDLSVCCCQGNSGRPTPSLCARGPRFETSQPLGTVAIRCTESKRRCHSP